VELLGRVGELNEQQLEFTRRVRFSVQSITSLINDLLELGKIEAGLDRQREPTYATLVARYAIEALQGRADLKHQQLTLEAPNETPQVLGNPIRLRQALANLIDNAIKYTPDGGAIAVQLFEEGEQVVIRVVDNGIGIPLADQPYIFDKFYRAGEVTETHEGTGLGLSIVKSIVEAHDGRIWVESHPEEGTAFTIMLPSYFPQESTTGVYRRGLEGAKG
jgi:signal transduction histidine kinase